jgi:phosphosulfolactate phosphohydrolase-like enzyme
VLAVERIHPGLLDERSREIAVVIDVLRATSTAVALLDRGAPRVRVVATPDELAGLGAAAQAPPYLVFSELAASRGFGLTCVDNSPALAETVDLAGRRPVLVTTNGTRAIAAAVTRAATVLVASFGNLSSTAEYLRAAGRPVALLPAGDFAGGEPRTEDERCADALEVMLRGEEADFPALLAACREDPRVVRRLARHPELARDIEVALAVDRHPVVAGVEAAGDLLELVRLAGGQI